MRSGPNSSISFRSLTLTAYNFVAIWTTETCSTSLKNDLKLFKGILMVQKTGNIFKMGLAFSKRPHFDNTSLIAYLFCYKIIPDLINCTALYCSITTKLNTEGCICTSTFMIHLLLGTKWIFFFSSPLCSVSIQRENSVFIQRQYFF